MSEPTPGSRPESPEHTVPDVVSERLSRAQDKAEEAAVLSDDFSVAHELAEVSSARIAVANEALRSSDLDEDKKDHLVDSKENDLGLKGLYESAESGTISDELAERISEYREGVAEVLEDVVDGDDKWLDQEYGKDAGRKRGHYKSLIKQAVKTQINQD